MEGGGAYLYGVTQVGGGGGGFAAWWNSYVECVAVGIEPRFDSLTFNLLIPFHFIS